MSKAEDWRYVEMRQKWGQNAFWWAYGQVFLLQSALLWIIALPLFMASPKEGMPLQWIQYLGAAMWLVGFVWEAVSDWQLSQFKKDPSNKGKLMMTGLWAYSRHPNYFGEILLWWGIYLFVLPWENAWMTILSPITITFLLMRVSGVPMLEAKYKGNQAYEAYKAKTNALVPRFW